VKQVNFGALRRTERQSCKADASWQPVIESPAQELLCRSLKIADAIAVAVEERLDVDLVADRVYLPEGIIRH
jgi:hypothetical protein